MSNKNREIYPNCPTITRTVEVGGHTKPELIQRMQQHSIFMNELAERLFADDNFTTSANPHTLKSVGLTVQGLGLPDGANNPQIFKRANHLGLELCPLELGPHLRLAYLDQPEGYLGKPSRQNQAPYGSITIASEPLTEDDSFPKGFYLRRIKGELWLRGYVADGQHVWAPDDHFIFCL